ncbi:nucleotidyl transferase AbiEii/AbiGii toxin family protein [Dawidia soli]|uniref:Nucleotidyl transferase AbiEii/AbiGii toxin family protein n=1 Tax=Dawidia soli TaxID=2782352 RepID=A0AAP2GJR3_9BACT|nr:nucleotidyl transferase AbiEii/AbiGii toxin family protein [Dawidia soli]MBT1688775.1 nucleotidyl transferase AbiEii/AbiGii toxin family protein [Dawidia soli]
MKGLSSAARGVIESFSSLEVLSDYYLIGGTSLALQINHRLSEDLDFCQWIPRYHVSYAIPQVQILEELKKRFHQVDENRIDFHQVNYVISDPPVRITFYQTALSKPIFKPIPLIGNISMADLSVLGGSKMYVITQRDALRDYYDFEQNHSQSVV